MPRPLASPPTSKAIFSLILPLLAASCTGYLEGNDGKSVSTPGDAGPAPGSDQNSNNSSISDLQALGCDPATRGTTELGVRRLTKPELVTSLTALFGSALMSRPEIVKSLTQLPEQTSVTNTQFDNSIVDVEGLEAVATTVTETLFADAAGAGQLLGCDVNDVAKCTDTLVGAFAAKAFRRPATSTTQQSIRSLVTSIGGLEGLKNGLIRVLVSPYFHQHLELGENADDCAGACPALDPQAARLRLSPYEVAERLAFQLTGAPPDDALSAAAQAGKLSEVPQIAEQARRLVASSAARNNWQRIATDWLGLNHVPDPDPVVAKSLGFESTGFGAEALQDFQRFVGYEAFEKSGTLYNLFTDPIGFPASDRLAKTLGVTQAEGAQPLTGGLGGVLLRPASLLSGTTLTSPILRGVFIKRKVLCAVLPTPDANLVKMAVDSSALTHTEHSNREFFTQLTSPAVCTACHTQVNSLGFALERFGPLGQLRDTEIIYDQTGPTGVTHPIDTVVDDLHISSAALPATGASDAIEQIAKSPDAQACFDAALIVNTRYRPLDATDNCLMAELEGLQKEGRPVSEALVQSVANEGIFWKSAAGLK